MRVDLKVLCGNDIERLQVSREHVEEISSSSILGRVILINYHVQALRA